MSRTPARGRGAILAVGLSSVLFSFSLWVAADGDPGARDRGLAGVVTQKAMIAPLENGALRVLLRVEDTPVTLELLPYSLRSKTFAMRRQTGGELREIAIPATRTFRGNVLGSVGGTVAASWNDGRLEALLILDDGSTWFVEPSEASAAGAAATEYLVYPSGAMTDAAGVCMAVAPAGVKFQERPAAEPTGTGCTQTCEIAFEADYAFFVDQGSSESNVLAEIENILNQVDLIYARDAQITYSLGQVLVQTTPGEDRYLSTGGGALLGEFDNYWTQNLGAIPRDVAHLITGRDLDGNTIGVAWIQGVCQADFGYGISQVTFNPLLAFRVGLVAHELGHNWGAAHCDGQPDCWIMCGGIGGCQGDVTRFGEAAIEAITDYRDSQSCLSPGDGTPVAVAPKVAGELVGTLAGDQVLIDVLANDTDGNCDALFISTFEGSTPAGGVVSRSVGTGPGGRDELLYIPPALYAGDDRFVYLVEDEIGLSTPGEVEVGVFDLRTPENPVDELPGLTASYYVPPVIDLSATPDFRELQPFLTEIVPTVNFPAGDGPIAGSGLLNKVGVVFEGTLAIDQPDTYAFYTESDDGSLLYVDGELVVDNDGQHGMQERSGSIELETGTHAVRIAYYDDGMSGGIIARIAGGGMAKQVIPSGLWSASGVEAAYYNLGAIYLPRFAGLTPYFRGTVDGLNFPATDGEIAGSGRADNVAAVFEGFITVPSPDLYTFYTESDDGSALYIGEDRVVWNDGPHGMRERFGFVGLEAGTHALRVEYVEAVFAGGLIVRLEGGGLPKQIVPAAWLSRVNGFVRVGGTVEDSGVGRNAAWGDYDGDGDEDLFVSNNGPNRLFQNLGEGVFEAVSDTVLEGDADTRAGVWGDTDNAGNPDLYLTVTGGANRYLKNTGGDFVDATAGPLGDTGDSQAASWVDYDADGDLDIYILNEGVGPANKLLRDDGASGFAEDTPTALAGSEDSRGAAWADHDGDGDLDVYVVNNGPNHLVQREGGLFVDATEPPFADTGDGRAASWADFDNDADLDLYILNNGDSRLLRNDGPGGFADVTQVLAAGASGDFRSVSWVDWDLDGWLDLYLVNGAGANRALRNTGAGGFVAEPPGVLSDSGAGTAAAWADYDADGDPDLYLVNADGPNRLFRNDTVTGNHWLQVDLRGVESTRSAFGATIAATWGEETRLRLLESSGSHPGQDALTVSFGLGTATMIDTLRVFWPSGSVQTLFNVSADQRLVITESADAEGFISQTITLDGINDFNPANRRDADGSDTETGDLCPEDPAPESPMDLGNIFITNDREFLYFGFDYDPDCFCFMNLGLAIDVNTPEGASTDAFSRQISWSQVPFKPDFYLYDVVPDGCNPDNFEIFYQWNGSAWTSMIEGPDALGIVDGPFTEFALPLPLLGVSEGDTLHLEFWVTQDFENRGPLDAAANDAAQLSIPAGTTYEVITPVEMTSMLEYVVLVDTHTPVELASFSAAREGNNAVLQWEILGEPTDHAGFHVYRENQAGDKIRISESLLRGKRTYSFVDGNAPAGAVRYWLAEVSRSGSQAWHGPVSLDPRSPGGAGLVLSQSRPNPFGDHTTIGFSSGVTTSVRLRIFDLSGRVVAEPFKGLVPPGDHEVEWDGKSHHGQKVAAGIYFYRLETREGVRVRRLIRLP